MEKTMKARDELLAKTRQRMKEQSSKWEADPNEFRPPRMARGQEAKYKLFVLAPVETGDVVASGTAKVGMSSWCVQVGDHWIDKRPYPCPRIYDNGEDCPLCKMGFELYQEAKGNAANDDTLKAIMREWMPQTKWWVNVYFPPLKNTPEELRDTVKWFALPKTPYSKMEACINADNIGDDETDPQAFGIFWFCDDDCTIPGGYPFSLEMSEKGGWNDYATSKFIYGQGQVPLAVKKGTTEPDLDKISEIMSRRHDLIAKLPARDVTVLENILKKKLGKVGTEVTATGSGFDNESRPVATPPVQTPAPKPVVAQKAPLQSVQKPVAVKPATVKPAPKPVVVEDEEVVATAEDEEVEVAPPPPKPAIAKASTVIAKKPVTAKPAPVAEPEADQEQPPASDEEEDQEVLSIMNQLRARKK